MTYATGSTILAADYNAFTSAANNINEVFGDLHSNAITIAAGGDFGYGLTVPAAVAPAQIITAAQWQTLFTNIRNVGTHQGTATTGVPGAGLPVVGSSIIAISAIPTVITNLRANRFNFAAGQLASIELTAPTTGSAPWTNTLTYTFAVNLGTWNQARYFFNTGGALGFVGAYPTGGAGTDDEMWSNYWNAMGQIHMRAKTTVTIPDPDPAKPNTINAGGFWRTTDAGVTYTPLPVDPAPYFEIYRTIYGGGGTYTNSSVSLRARLAGTPPAVNAGTIQFQIIATQTDSIPPLQVKSGPTTFTLVELHSIGVIPFLSGAGGPGPASVIVVPGSYVLT